MEQPSDIALPCREEDCLITESTSSSDDSKPIRPLCVPCLVRPDSYESQAFFQKPSSMNYLQSMNLKLDELLDVLSEEIPVFSPDDVSTPRSEGSSQHFTLNLKRNTLLKLRRSL